MYTVASSSAINYRSPMLLRLFIAGLLFLCIFLSLFCTYLHNSYLFIYILFIKELSACALVRLRWEANGESYWL